MWEQITRASMYDLLKTVCIEINVIYEKET